MIIKKIESGAIVSKAGYARRLTNYILQPQKSKTQEKVLYSACSGFISEDMQSAQAEMSAMADGAKSSANSVMHLVISWREGEQPTPDQVDEAVRLLMTELGLEGHGVIYALHLDTDNLHCHVAISRVHPVTEKVTAANRGFDLEGIHRAIARIEHAQGWEREAHGRYRVTDNGQLARYGNGDKSSKRPRQHRQDMEHRTGAKSAQRLAIEKAGPVITGASNWDELHKSLASMGMRYVKTGSGAVVFVGDTAVKASSIDRNASLIRVQKRLGPYQPSINSTLAMTPVALEKSQALQPVEPAVPRWQTFIQERQAFYTARDQARRQLQNEQDAERQALIAQQSSQRQEILSGDWTQMGAARMALRSILAAQQVAEKLNLKSSHQNQRMALKAQFSGFPDFESWLRQGQFVDDADAWRYRHSQWPRFKAAPSGSDTVSTIAPTRDIRAFQAHAVGNEVQYSKVHALAGLQMVAFIDRGNHIDICDDLDDNAIVAAMQLAGQKWGAFEIEGDAVFQQRCIELAAQNGIFLANPELQAPLAAAREKLRRDNEDAGRWTPMQQALTPYLLAMQAPRYLIRASQVRGNGPNIIGRMISADGNQNDSTVADLIQHEFRMLDELRGGSLLKQGMTIEPVFNDKMVLRINDVSEQQLLILQQAGFEARAVLEVEPSRYELLLTVPAVDLEHASQAIVKFGNLMKFQYRVQVEACGQGSDGHAMPGSASERHPHHIVNVHSSKRQDCSKTVNSIYALDFALARVAQKEMNRADLHRAGSIELSDEKKVGPVEMAFAAHRADICKRAQGRPMDASRIDAQVALRLKMTGYDRTDVETVLITCSPQHAVGKSQRDWELYAKRATDFAWGPAGQRQAKLQALQIPLWEALARSLIRSDILPQ